MQRVGICDAYSNSFNSLVGETLRFTQAYDSMGSRGHRKTPSPPNVSPHIPLIVEAFGLTSSSFKIQMPPEG